MLTLLALLAAQPPAALPPAPQPPARPAAPPAGLPGQPEVQKAEDLYPQPDPAVVLPHPEQTLKVGPRSLAVRPAGGGYVLYAGTVPLRDFGPDRQAADAALRAVRDLPQTTDLGTLGGSRPVADYALAGGRASGFGLTAGLGRTIDLPTVRAEPVRGAWLVRDDLGLLLNCGPDRATAEQAAAVCKRYGFNRLVRVGGDARPSYQLLCAAPTVNAPKPPPEARLAAALQEQTLTRTGVPLPGGGFAGERVVLDPRLVEARRERGDWVLAHGPEVLARFGGDDAAAREAARMVKEQRLTEFCTVGGLTFLLSNGRPQARVPGSARATPLRADALKVVPLDGRWAVVEGGRPLGVAGSEAEAKEMLAVIAAYKFDTAARLGVSPRAGLTVLARTGGR
jgi:hypothetical protein